MENMNKSFIIRNKNVIGMDTQRVYTSTPVGIIQPFASDTNIPRGYLLCDGASYPTADYPDLYAVIGNTYGGDSTNFNVPNLVDKFIQGSTTSGEEKEAGLPNITGRASYPSGLARDGSFYSTTYGSEKFSMQGGVGNGALAFDASRSSAIYGKSDTVQPPALTMVYIIKAFHTNEGVDSGVSDDVINYVEGEIAKVDTELSAKVTDVVILVHKTQQYTIPKNNYQYGLPININVPEDVTFVSIISCNCTSSFCNVSLTGGLGKDTTIDVSNLSDWEEKTFVNILYLCVKK